MLFGRLVSHCGNERKVALKVVGLLLFPYKSGKDALPFTVCVDDGSKVISRWTSCQQLTCSWIPSGKRHNSKKTKKKRGQGLVLPSGSANHLIRSIYAFYSLAHSGPFSQLLCRRAIHIISKCFLSLFVIFQKKKTFPLIIKAVWRL